MEGVPTAAIRPMSHATLYTWGFGKYGQLGNGTLSTCNTPQLVRLPAGAIPRRVATGAHFTLILSEKKGRSETELGERARGGDQLFACGWGKYGRLGTGTMDDQSSASPINLPSRERASRFIHHVCAGHWHAGCVTEDGNTYMWGYNKGGILGLAESSSATEGGSSATPSLAPPLVLSPTLLPSAVRFAFISCSYNYTYAISVEGAVYSWGANRRGVLGHGDTHDRPSPQPIAAVKENRFLSIACGYSHTALVETTGHLYTVGSGEAGALGHGKDMSDRLIPTLVESLAAESVDVKGASCTQGERHAHSLCYSSDGGVWSWGDGYKGKLGHGSQESCNVPRIIDPGHFLNQRVCQVGK